MRIAICDDDAIQIHAIEEYVAQRPGHEIVVCTSGVALLQHAKDVFDLIILDVELSDMLGTKLAARIKKDCKNTDIMFISSYPKYVTSAFYVQAVQFLTKPFSSDEFLYEFDFIVEQRAKKNFRWCVTNKNSVYSVSPSKIIFVEAYHRHLFIQTDTERIDICGKIKDAATILRGYGFSLCHQGFLVNMNYIERIEQNTLTCKGNQELPISTRKRTFFLREYTQFLTQNHKSSAVD